MLTTAVHNTMLTSCSLLVPAHLPLPILCQAFFEIEAAARKSQHFGSEVPSTCCFFLFL